MPEIAYIGVGSNLGDRSTLCRKAVARVDRLPGCRVTGCSSLYRTEPVGVQGQDWYLNAAIAAEVEGSAAELLTGLLAIEADLGRVRRQRWEARPIDLDLLLFGPHVIRGDRLTVPHPRMHQRRFVLIPLVELAPDLRHPVRAQTMRDLLDALPPDGQEVEYMKGM